MTPPVSVQSRIGTYETLQVYSEEVSIRKQVEDRIRPAVLTERSVLPLQMETGYHSIYNDVPQAQNTQ